MQFRRKALSAVVAILALTACDRSPEAKETRYLQKGKKEFEKRNYAVAVLHFKNASEAKPWDAEPYYQLGLAYLAENDFKSAAAAFRKATDVNPRHTSAQLKFAEMLAAARDQGSIEESRKRIQAVLALLPDDPDALYVFAVTDLRQGKPDNAQSHLEQGLRKSPVHLKSWILLAQIKGARNDLAGAEQALQQASTRLPKSPTPRIELGKFYLAHQRTSEAEQQFRQALGIDPKNGPALMELGAMQVKAGHLDQADQTYQRVSALADRQYKPVHAEFLFRSGKRDQAVTEFAKLHAADPGDINMRTRLIDAYLAVNRAGEAEKVLTAAVKKNGLDQDALLRRSRIYLAWGKYTQAEADLNQVLHYHKDSAEALSLLAKVDQGRANPTLQTQNLEAALKINPANLGARIDLARALAVSQGPGAALALLDEAPKGQMNAISLILQRNWALLSLGNVAEARKGIDRVLARGKVPEALLQDGAVKLFQKNYPEARKSIEEALSRTPGDTRALLALLETYAAQKQTPAGIQIVREFAARQPGSAPVQQFLGQILSANGDRAGARKAFEAAKAARPNSVDADLSLAQLDVAEGKLDTAGKRLSEVVSSHPDNKTGHLLLARYEITTGKNQDAIEQFRKLVALDSKDVAALNGLAYLLAGNNHADEALGYAQKAKELAPDNPAVDDTLGWVYYQQGLYQVAVDQFVAATGESAAGSGMAVRKYHLAMAYLKAGDRDRGRQTLDAALKIDPKLPEAQAARQAFGVGSH